ncbi:hypothetical protein VP01_36g16 [Puccinia sorghi]|uniref:Uncharacterized protein n=1 Tax=Puccinia sorghi TaxID=27349 RepID=A0A0L6UUZ7_9BASI|nr:hypothetical protein VP01_36g16 [Puccinia sorghi]
MDGGAISEKPLPRSQNTYCDCNILVVPPCFHPTGRVHSPGTFHLSTKDPTRFPIHPGGIIIPLQPSLRSQISEVARPRIISEPTAGGWVAVQLEFRIDYHTASWYEAWLMSKFCPSAPTTGNLDPSLKVHRRCSETDSSYCGRLSHSTAPTSIPASPLPPVRTPENQLKPSPILPDGLTGPVRSRSIYLLSQKRQYRRFHPTEHRGEHKNTLLPLSRNRKKSQDSDLFTTPPSSEPESRSSKPHHQRSIPTISHHDAHPTSTEKITPRDKIPQGRRNSIDADFMPGVLEKEIKMICKHNSRDPVCNHPRIRDSYFPFEVDDPQQSVKDKTYSTSEKISMDPENDAIISEDTCIYRGTDDKRSPKLDLVSDWKKFLVQMTPPSVGSSREVGGDYVGNKHMCGRKRPVPQPLNLVPVETSEPLPVISPELSLASSTSSSLRIRETKRTPDLELKTIREEPHNSEIYPEDKISISSSSPTSFVNTLPPSVIRNLVGRSKMPWRRSRTNESLRSDSVKIRSTFQDDALNNLNGLYSANDTPRNGKSFSSPAYTTPDSNSSSDSFSIGDLSHSLLDLPLESPAPRRDRPLVRVSGPPKAREVKRQSKLMDPDAARFPASWHMKCIHLQSFLPISLTRNASISSFTSQTVIQKAKKVGILNNSTSRLTTLTPPASSKSTK